MRKEIKKVEITCDLCKKVDEKCIQVSYPVLFTSDQTEGRWCTPYISQEKVDLCPDCAKEAIRITGYGAQGYNSFRFIKQETGKNTENT